MICPSYPTPFLFFFSETVPPIIYYSHFPILIIAIFISIFILIKDKFSLLSRALATPLFLFALWLIIDLVTWTSNSSDQIMFVWSFFGILFVLINFFFLRFLYVFIKGSDVPFWGYFSSFVLTLPVIALSITQWNLTKFDSVLCASVEGNYYLYYYHGVGLLIFLYMCFFIIKSYLQSVSYEKSKILLIGSGTISFLFFFFLTGFLGSFLKSAGLTADYQIEQYGFFPIIIFLIFLADTVISYKIFNIKLLSMKILAFGLACFVGAQFFFIREFINFVLNGVTFVATLIFGYYLIKSVQKEIAQKEELAKLNIDLNELIKQRESLVHLVTHKVKGSFTRSKYMFAGILDGTFGETSAEIKKVAEQGLESDNMGIETVDLVLNVANMQKGTVKYDMKPMNLREIVEKSMAEKKIVAEAKGLVIQNNIKDGAYNISGDVFWMKEAINNLIENSIKYTKAGSITVGLEKQTDKILVSVKDTGVGITDEDKKGLFTEGGRGKDSVKVNVDSTGYGLYSVKLIISAHKGRVWAESEGAGKGSTFFIELDAA